MAYDSQLMRCGYNIKHIELRIGSPCFGVSTAEKLILLYNVKDKPKTIENFLFQADLAYKTEWNR